jgi:hypothetical protein
MEHLGAGVRGVPLNNLRREVGTGSDQVKKLWLERGFQGRAPMKTLSDSLNLEMEKKIA